jgi:aryl-alcohol dehydrogenase-like predicted oxidoreductase
MHYRPLGRSGLKVSPICLGTMMFGGPTEEADAAKIIAHAREAGINFIDTADGYTGGKSEEITGRAIKTDRHWWVLATKLANPTMEGPNGRGTSRRHIQYAIEASLRRMQTETIDVLYLHKEDHTTPLAETVRALGDAVRAGKIRYIGLSNYRSWRVAEIACEGRWQSRPMERWRCAERGGVKPGHLVG